MQSKQEGIESVQQDVQLKQLSKRWAMLIAQSEVAQEKMERWQKEASELIDAQQVRLESQLAAINKQSNAMEAFMTDAGAARFRLAAEQSLQQGQQHIKAIEVLFQEQQSNFEKQQKKLDETVATHMSEMKNAESRVSKKIQNFLAELNVKEMRELADTSRIAIEQTSSDAILKSSKLLRGFNWKHFAFVITVVAFNTLILTMYINDEMPWETHQHAIQERLAGQTLLKAWPTLPDDAKQHILSYSKKYQRA